MALGRRSFAVAALAAAEEATGGPGRRRLGVFPRTRGRRRGGRGRVDRRAPGRDTDLPGCGFGGPGRSSGERGECRLRDWPE
eukprot:scaffold6950_cov229-Prasinococcus_capsulatus_cf.AAC.2